MKSAWFNRFSSLTETSWFNRISTKLSVNGTSSKLITIWFCTGLQSTTLWRQVCSKWSNNNMNPEFATIFISRKRRKPTNSTKPESTWISQQFQYYQEEAARLMSWTTSSSSLGVFTKDNSTIWMFKMISYRLISIHLIQPWNPNARLNSLRKCLKSASSKNNT